jgi:hypothetical protein
MHDASEVGGSPVVAKDAEEIVPGIVTVEAWSAVDEDGKAGFGGYGELLAEGLSLDVSGRVAVPVVESDFADGDELWVRSELAEVVEVRVGEQARFVGMDSGGGVDPGVTLGEGQGTGDVVGAVPVADGEESADARVVSTLDHGIAVGRELGTVEVGVGI